MSGFVIVKVELIGYAASDDELFLIYEYAQKGSLKNHLHEPQNKGNTLRPVRSPNMKSLHSK